MSQRCAHHARPRRRRRTLAGPGSEMRARSRAPQMRAPRPRVCAWRGSPVLHSSATAAERTASSGRGGAARPRTEKRRAPACNVRASERNCEREEAERQRCGRQPTRARVPARSRLLRRGGRARGCVPAAARSWRRGGCWGASGASERLRVARPCPCASATERAGCCQLLVASAQRQGASPHTFIGPKSGTKGKTRRGWQW